MADRLGENGAVRYAQDRWSFDNNDSRLGGAGHIASEIRRLAQEGKHTDYVSGLTVKGRLINRMIDVVYWPRKLFANNEVGAWFDPSDVNLNWRRNLLTYTEQFDNAAWTKTAATISANVEVAPDGTSTADKLVENTASATTHGITQSYNSASGTVVTMSCYLKAAERTWCRLSVNTATGANASAYFNLSSGSLGSVAGGTASIVSAGNGWYKCSVTGTLTTTNPQLLIYLASGDVGQVYTGDGTSGVYIWGAQLELGSTATDYQRIVTPEITYVADVQPQPILYQDAAGTTPVTAVEQPVGLMLDKSEGLVIGPELVTNGTFDTDTTGWTTTSGSLTVESGKGKLQNSGAVSALSSTPITTIANKTYKITIECQNVTALNNCRLYVGTTAGSFNLLALSTENGDVTLRTLEGYFLATGTTSYVSISNRAITDAIVFYDNISVKEIAGNHAFQSTSTSRPVLRSRYNLLTYSEQFGNAAWLPVNATKTANALTAPNGTVTAGKLIANTASAVSHSLLITSGATLNVQYTYSVYVKESGYTNIQLFGDSSGNFTVTFNLITVTAAFGGDAISATITDVGDGWFRCTAVFTMKSNSRLNIQGFPTGATASNFGNTFTGDGTSGIYIWGADLRVTNDALNQPSYQRIAAATDYDTVGFLPYLQFDGTDDSMATNSIDFTGTDKMTVWAGVRKLSDAATGAIFESSVSSSANNGAFIAYNEGASGKQGWGFNSRGTSAPSAAQVIAGYMAPITNILTGLGDIAGDSAVLRINATIVASSTADQGTGNYGNYPLYIGRRGGSTLPFTGRLYGLVIRGTQSTNAEITNTETWMNARTGAF